MEGDGLVLVLMLTDPLQKVESAGLLIILVCMYPHIQERKNYELI